LAAWVGIYPDQVMVCKSQMVPTKDAHLLKVYVTAQVISNGMGEGIVLPKSGDICRHGSGMELLQSGGESISNDEEVV